MIILEFIEVGFQKIERVLLEILRLSRFVKMLEVNLSFVDICKILVQLLSFFLDNTCWLHFSISINCLVRIVFWELRHALIVFVEC